MVHAAQWLRLLSRKTHGLSFGRIVYPYHFTFFHGDSQFSGICDAILCDVLVGIENIRLTCAGVYPCLISDHTISLRLRAKYGSISLIIPIYVNYTIYMVYYIFFIHRCE